MTRFAEFFDEISRLLSEAQKNHGFANRRYILERMEMALSTCGELQLRLHDSSPDSDMQEYLFTFNELIIHMRFIYRKWCDYEAILDSQ